MLKADMKTVVLTGGTGFLGYHLIQVLRDKGYAIRLLRRKGSVHPLMQEFPDGVEPIELEFEDASAVQTACVGAEYVIHAAGLVSYDKKDQPLMRQTHVILTQQMLAAARQARVKRFVHVSSIVTLGHGEELRDENAVYNACNLRLAYWDTKLEAEQIALSAATDAFEVVVVNPGSLIGEGEKNGQLLPFVRKLLKSERPFLPDGGSDFLDVRDAAEGTVLALELGRSRERYVLGSENLSYVGFHRRLRECFGLRSRPHMVPCWLLAVAALALELFERMTKIDLSVNSGRLRRVNGVHMYHDLGKAKRELGYQPRPLDRALAAMLEKNRE